MTKTRLPEPHVYSVMAKVQLKPFTTPHMFYGVIDVDDDESFEEAFINELSATYTDDAFVQEVLEENEDDLDFPIQIVRMTRLAHFKTRMGLDSFIQDFGPIKE